MLIKEEDIKNIIKSYVKLPENKDDRLNLLYNKKIDDDKNTIIIESCGFYDKEVKPNKRYLLDINIKNKDKKKILYVIMFNPSEKDLEKYKKNVYVDRTITNIIKIANDCHYNKIYILNLFPNISPKPDNFEEDKLNTALIESIQDSDILLAWGQIKDKKKCIKNLKINIFNLLKENNNNIKTFCPGKKDFPKHPGRININKCRCCLKNNDLINFKYQNSYSAN